MKFFKYFLLTVSLSIATLIMALNSLSTLSSVLKPTLNDFNISYKRLSGSIFKNIKVENLSYQNGVFLDFEIDFDFLALFDKKISIDKIEIDKLKIEESFIASLQNSKKEPEKEKTQTEIPYFKYITIASIKLNAVENSYKNIELKNLNIDIDSFDFDIERKIAKLNLKSSIDSNFAKLKLDSNLIDKKYNLKAQIEPIYKNLSIDKPLFLDIDGDFTNLLAKLNIDSKIDYNSQKIEFKNFILDSKVDLKSLKTKSKLKTEILSDYVKMDLKANANADIENLKSSLEYLAEIELENLKAPKIDLKDSKIDTKIEGDFNSLISSSEIFLNLIANDIELESKNIKVTNRLDLISLDLKNSLNADVDSNIAKVKLELDSKLNLNDINETLKYSSKVAISDIKNEYIYKYVNDKNISLKDTDLKVELNGDIKKSKIDLDLIAKNIYREFNATLKSIAKINLDILNRELSSDKLDLNISSLIADIDSKVKKLNFKMDTIDLKYELNSNIIKAKRFREFNLKPFSKTKLIAEGTQKSIDLKFLSKPIKLSAKSDNLNLFKFNLKSNLNPKDISKKIEIDSINFNADGSYDLTKKYLNSRLKLNSLKILDEEVKSNQIKLKVLDKNIELKDAKLFFKDERIDLNLKTDTENIDAKIVSKDIKAEIDGELNNIFIDLNIDSIKNLQERVSKLYPFKKLEVDGDIKLKANVKDRKYITAKLISKELKYEDIYIKNLNLKTRAKEAKSEILIDKFDFKLYRFDQINQDFNLSKDAKVVFEKPYIRLKNFNFNKTLSLSANIADDMELKVKSRKFPIYKKEYGKTLLDSDIDIYLSKDYRIIGGEAILNQTDIYYAPPKSISIERDRDIIILDKTKKEQSEKNPNLYIDFKIKNRDKIVYVNENGKIILHKNIQVEKNFHESLSLIGEVKLEKGYYNFEGKKFNIEPSVVTFVKSENINPILNLKLRYEENNQIVYIYIKGLAKSPKITFEAEPYMSKKDILSFLLFGKRSDELLDSKSSGGNTNYSQKALIFLSNAITKDLAKELGLDVDKIDISQDENSNSVSFEVGKRITKDLTINYKNTSDKNSIILEYELDKNMGLESEISDKSNSFGIYYEREF